MSASDDERVPLQCHDVEMREICATLRQLGYELVAAPTEHADGSATWDFATWRITKVGARRAA